MRTRIDEQLVSQVDTYQLRFTCEFCSNFDDQENRCSLGYPSTPHRLHVLSIDRHLLFCKEFELV
jgi:hypothetical protein